jgi:hypothetical protein
MMRSVERPAAARSTSFYLFPIGAILGVLCLTSLPLAAEADRFLSFEAIPRAQGADLVAAGKTIVRLRPGMHVEGGASALADALNHLAFAGLKADGLSVRSVSGGAQIMAGGTALVAIDKATAQACDTTPQGLAASWVQNIATALRTPYVILEPHGRLQVPLAETRALHWGGTAGTNVTFSVNDAAVASVDLSDSGRALMVRGLGAGSTVLTATMEGDSVGLPVDVKPWAARLPRLAVAEVSSPPLPEDDLRRTLRNAVLAATQPAPGSVVELGEPQRVGNRYELPLAASGQGCFDVKACVPVDVRLTTPPTTPVRQLLVSNQPEKITEPGTLMRERLVGKSAVRLLWHHVNKGDRPVRFAVRLVNLGDQPARVHVTDAATGPHDDEIYVGHQAMVRYLALVEQGEGYALTVPPGRVLDLYDVRLPVEGIVSGLARICPLEADNLLLEIVADNAWPTDSYFAPVPERLRNDPPLTPYHFEADKEVDLKYQAGGDWTFYQIGKEFSTNLQGQKLFGDYGVRYAITVTCTNPTTGTVPCLITLKAGGGVARATYYLDNRLTETGLLRPGAEETLARFDLEPGAQRVIKLVTLPESGSNYPLTLTVRKL